MVYAVDILQHFVAEATNAMAMFDRKMRYLAASPSWLADHRLTDEAIGRSHYEVLPEISSEWKAVHRRCLAGATERSECDRFQRADGRVQWVKWEVRPWRKADGAIGGIIIASVDITDRVEGQEKAETLARKLAGAVAQLEESTRRAQEAEQRLKDAIDASPAGLVIYDANDRLVVCNETTRAMYPHLTDLLRPGVSVEHLPRVGFDCQGYGQIVADKEKWLQVRLERRRNPIGPFEHVTPDGRCLRIEERRTRDGGFVSIRTDITDLKERERELARKTALFETTLEHMGEGIVVYDADRTVSVANELAARLIGLPPELCKPGVSMDDINRFRITRGDHGDVEDVESLVSERVRWFRARKPFTRTRRLPDGSTIDSRFNPAPDGGGILVMRDVTERADNEAKLAKALAEAEQASQAKSQFLAMVSHELRTPMNSIIGLSSLLSEGDLNPEERRQAEAIEAAGETLLAVISDLLEFASLEMGRAVLDVAPFDMRALAATTIDMARASPQAAGRSIGCDVDPGVPSALEGDGGRIRRVLFNLVDNAVKHTAEGPVTIRARAKPAAGDKILLRIEVEDAGAGFAAADAPQLFLPFERGGSAHGARVAGLGLGLAIAQSLVDLMGGTIGADSDPGFGSCFWFEAPVRSATPVSRSETGLAKASRVPRALKVLVAEDIEANRAVMGAMLERLGHEAHFVGDGAKAIEAVQKDEYDVVLMDLQMPNVDGLTATRAIRGLGGALKTIPIIVVSAYSLPVEKEAAVNAGASGFLCKPVRRSALDEALRLRSG
jgi:PAS domain S-box-containing protein